MQQPSPNKPPERINNTLHFRGKLFDPTLVRHELLHEIFETTARLKPDNIALICEDKSIKYSELESMANQFANYLALHGVKKNDFVGIYLPRGINIYVAMLGILKAGAAYTPFDPEFPVDRVNHGLNDSKSILLITDSSLVPMDSAFACPAIFINEVHHAIDQQSDVQLHKVKLSPEDSAYAICTSGTTGRPKCIEISHEAVCNLVRSEERVLQIKESDIFYQGFSIAFDASIEEIWLTFATAATLFVGTKEIVHSGADLADILTKAKVTVISCVPTLLSMLEQDIPTLRQINFAGEPCPQELVRRWYRPGRKIFNTYGPTEATVTSTYTLVHPDIKVTIGRALPNYTTYILDENMQSVATGETGELCIGGIGLAKGYMGKPDLTAQKFVPNPYYTKETNDPLLYKTGDLVKFTEDGDIEFMGRIDTQIKLRGFRIEIAEIEGVLMEHPDISAAAVTLHKDIYGISRLIAYVIMKEGQSGHIEDIREYTRKHLPKYMVPAIIQMIDEFPTMASGKVDRNLLPEPIFSHNKHDIIPPKNEFESVLLTVWQKFFPEIKISTKNNFFDLGGHSLLAATFISELRTLPEFQAVSIRDLYKHPTIESLATYVMKTKKNKKSNAEAFHKASKLSYFICSIAQAISLYFIIGVYMMLGVIGPYIIYHWMKYILDYNFSIAALAALSSFLFFLPVIFLVPVLMKWIVIGRYKPGEYPLWGMYYFRWWFVNQMINIVPSGYLAGTNVLNIYLRLLGAKIGNNVFLGEDTVDAFDLIEVGENSSISNGTILMTVKVEDGLLKISKVTIGKNCHIGVSSVLEQGTIMEDNSELENMSLLPKNTTINSHEIWSGSPARKTKVKSAGPSSRYNVKFLTRLLYSLMHTILVFIFPMFVMFPLFPSMLLFDYFDPEHLSSIYILYSPIFALSYILIYCTQVVILKWVLMGKIKSGVYSTYSGFYLRKWIFDKVMEVSQGVLHPIYASLYIIPWYRALGMKIGKGTEISTATSFYPDLVNIQDHCFIADGVYLGIEKIHNNQMYILPITLGSYTFIGNSAVIPGGSTIGTHCLIGCMSVTPTRHLAVPDNTSWFGSPAVKIPAREKFDNYSDRLLYHPSKAAYLGRLMVEFIRIIFPLTCYTILLVIILELLAHMYFDNEFSLLNILIIFPFLGLGFGLATLVITVIVKWLVIGKYTPTTKPIWNHFVWRSEFVTSLYESLVAPFLTSMLVGTPYINWAFRSLGCKIGKRVFNYTTDITEFDMIDVGDDVALNYGCDLQTHLFEDRVMKISNIHIGNNCTIGALAVVLYDTKMEHDSSIGSLSIIMKGETLPANTHWEGSPAMFVK